MPDSRLENVVLDPVREPQVWDSARAQTTGMTEAGQLASVSLVDARSPNFAETATVEKLATAFTVRSTGKPATVRGFQQTIDSLKEYQGASTPLAEITAEQADGWRVWVANDREGSGKRRKKRTTVDNRLSPATIAKSPFDGLRPGS